MITLGGINKVYRTKEIETTALENVNLQVNRGEFLSIMGPSGCGKSTLLNIIGLLDKPTGGTVTLLDKNCDNMSDKDLSHFRNHNIGFVFQSFHLIPSLSVADNVELPLVYRSGLSARDRREKVEQVLERLEMSHRIKHLPAQLSGGQCQRVAIARAIIGNPAIV
ncbi:MAG: ABC transporter ATP-binding protein, partial [Muribaculaceae bacterium]|nr:ABC transporter ATP-binding protein [Muribaculaceae bacterium]